MLRFLTTFVIQFVAILLVLNLALAINPGDPSLSDRAYEAFDSEDWETSIQLFEKLLEVNPDYSGYWYYIACSYASNEDSEKSIQSLQNALLSGYKTPNRILENEAFSSILEDPEFQKIIEEMEKLSKESSENTHYVLQTIYSPYNLKYPDGYDAENPDGYPLVVVLLFDLEMNIDAIENLGMDEVIYLYANAPYHQMRDELRYAYLTGGMPSYPTVMKNNSDWIASTVRDAFSQANIDTNRVGIFGFSQGGLSVYTTTMNHPDLFTAAAPLGGWIPNAYQLEENYLKLKESGVDFFIGHGTLDQVIDPARADSASKWLSEAGVDVTNRRFESGHDLTEEMATGLREWLNKEFELVE